MISERIEEIVIGRKSKLKKVETVQKNVEEIFAAVKKIENIQMRLSDVSKTDLLVDMLRKQPEVCENISRIDTNEFYGLYKKYLTDLTKIKERFSRDTLNISFVGAAGQGKSCVLQQISGLGGDVIPSAAGSDCTGAKSIISNSSGDEVKAEITFYSQQEVVEIINDYLEEILGCTTYNISSISQAKSIDVSVIEEEVRFDADAKGKLKQLKKYVQHINDEDVVKNLGQVKLVNKNEIEQYVAQHSCQDKSIPYYKYLGVKCANIICPFPKRDAGRIVLVDTKGLGDTAIKVDKNMLNAAENDSDAIVLMYRPDALRAGLQQREIDILKKIEDRITPEYCEQLLFWVVNRVETGDGKNTDVIKEAKQEIVKSNMPIAGVLEVNCGNQKNVEDELLVPVLTGLTERIEKVDGFIISHLNERAEQLINKFETISSALEGAFINGAGEDIKRQMNSTIESTKDEMLNSIRNIYLELNGYREKPCEEFQSACEMKLKNILKTVPRKDEVIELLKKGTNNHLNVYEECTNVIRMKIIDDFLELDDVLEKIVDNMKKRIVCQMRDNVGKLGYISKKNGENPNEWIDEFVDKINASSERYPLISRAMDNLREFTISVEGFMIYEVRDKLDAIDLSLLPQNPEIEPNGLNKEKQAEDIIFWLDKYLVDIYDELRKSIIEFFKVPNRALFAAVKDFYDRATYSGNDTYDNIQTEWRYLYEEWLPIIWKEEYAINMNGIEAYKEWNDIIKQINGTVDKDSVLIY